MPINLSERQIIYGQNYSNEKLLAVSSDLMRRNSDESCELNTKGADLEMGEKKEFKLLSKGPNPTANLLCVVKAL